VALGWFCSGHIARANGDHERARAYIEASAGPLRELGDRRYFAYILTSLGMLALDMGDLDAGRRHYGEALEINRDFDDTLSSLVTLEALAGALAASGETRRAARLMGVVSTHRVRLGWPSEPAPGVDERRQRTLDRLRHSLSERELAVALAAGRRLTPKLAVLEVLSQESIARRSSVQSTSQLSERELEVARLVANGLTNREIARQLVIAEPTAQRHVANVLGKLSFTSRAQIVVWVHERYAEAAD